MPGATNLPSLEVEGKVISEETSVRFTLFKRVQNHLSLGCVDQNSFFPFTKQASQQVNKRKRDNGSGKTKVKVASLKPRYIGVDCWPSLIELF